jgi:hypothetical protein
MILDRLATMTAPEATPPELRQAELSSAELSSAKWIVCERRPLWVAAMRRCVASTVRLDEVRSPSACWERLAEFPSSVVVWEIGVAPLENLLEILSRQRRWYPGSCPMVVGQRGEAGHQWLLREAGAVHAAFALRRASVITALAQRHLREVQPPAAWSRPLLPRLPWEPPAGTETGPRNSPENGHNAADKGGHPG